MSHHQLKSEFHSTLNTAFLNDALEKYSIVHLARSVVNFGIFFITLATAVSIREIHQHYCSKKFDYKAWLGAYAAFCVFSALLHLIVYFSITNTKKKYLLAKVVELIHFICILIPRLILLIWANVKIY